MKSKEEPVFTLLGKCYEELLETQAIAKEIIENIDKVLDKEGDRRVEVETLASPPSPPEAAEINPPSEHARLTQLETRPRSRPQKQSQAPAPSLSTANAPTTISGTQILKDFAYEVASWRKLSVKQPSPAKFASYLAEKYLVQLLQPLPESKLVKVAKQAIGTEIEKIVAMEQVEQKIPPTSRAIQQRRKIATSGSRKQSIEERKRWNAIQTQRSRKGREAKHSTPAAQDNMIGRAFDAHAKQLEISPRQSMAHPPQFQSVEDLLRKAEHQENSLRNLRAQSGYGQ